MGLQGVGDFLWASGLGFMGFRPCRLMGFSAKFEASCCMCSSVSPG